MKHFKSNQLNTSKLIISKIIKILIIVIISIIGLIILLNIIPLKSLLRIEDIRISNSTVPHDFIEIDGKNIFILDNKETTNEETILFIHGMGGSTYCWRKTIPHFIEEGYRVIAIDLKGFGLSHKDYNSDYSHPAQADIIKKLLDKLGVNKAHIVGHSMGGSVAVHFTYKYKEYAQSLTIIDGAVYTEKHTKNQNIFKNIVNFPLFIKPAQHIVRMIVTKDYIRKLLESAYYNKELITDDMVLSYYSRFVIGDFDLSYFAMIRDADNNIIDFNLSEIDCPVLIIWGRNDPWIDISNAERIRSLIPHADLKIIDKSGHLPMEDQSEQFNILFDDFLNTY